MEDQANVSDKYKVIVIDQRHKYSSNPIPKTSAVVHERQHQTGEMEGCGEVEFDEEIESGKNWKSIGMEDD